MTRRHNFYPSWSPRFWNGMRLGSYWKLLCRNHFRIHPLRIPMALVIFGCSLMNSPLAALQRRRFGARVRTTRIDQGPIFVVGHWRTGTTLLHELLALDRRLAFPSTYECFVPQHFLVSSGFLRPLIRMLLPARRPMDDMPAGVNLPQEEEFALCAMGAPTPYERIAFCHQPLMFHELLDMQDVSPQVEAKFYESLVEFYQALTLKHGKPLVLKSPTHTGRISHLAQWFPKARFVHIARHPSKVIPSTIHLWRSLYAVAGFQLPRFSDVELADYVFECFQRMYRGYFAHRQSLGDRLFEIRFEDLLADPIEQLTAIYEALQLGDFEPVRPAVHDYLQQRDDYRAGSNPVNETLRHRIELQCAEYCACFGYKDEQSPMHSDNGLHAVGATQQVDSAPHI